MCLTASSGDPKRKLHITGVWWEQSTVNRWIALTKCQAVMGKVFPYYGPLTRYVTLWVAHAPGMPGMFSPPPRVNDPDRHHRTCVTHVLWCMPGSLSSGFLWSRWWGRRSQHSRRMRKPQFCISGKRPMSSSWEPADKHWWHQQPLLTDKLPISD